MTPARRLLTPKWLLSHLVVLLIAVVFSLLGLWQLDRHREQVDTNELIAARLEQPPVGLDVLLAEAGGDLASIEYRQATVSGVFLPEEEILIRSQVHLGAPGFHLVTPLDIGGGAGVLVNRGWVPIIYDTVPVDEARPASGSVEVDGWVRLSQERPAFGPSDPESGRTAVFSRVNIPRLQEQMSVELAPVYLVGSGENEGLPETLRLPSFDDAGPHLAYAIQWFGFALVGLIGYLFLVRRRLQTSASPSTTS